MSDSHSDVFISYRRGNGSGLAQVVHTHLAEHKYSVFRDTQNMQPGPFPAQIERAIIECTDFVLVLTEGCLQGKWVQQEIALALRQRRNIVPFKSHDFEMPKREDLPEDIAGLVDHEYVEYISQFPDASLDRLRKMLKSKPRRVDGRLPWWWVPALAAILLVAILGGLWWVLREGPGPGPEEPPPVSLPLSVFPSPAPTPIPDRSRYGFETGAQGWVSQDYEDSQACTAAAQSDERAKLGRHSLEMKVDLVGGDYGKGSGEAWVNWKDAPLASPDPPVDLTGYVITAWVYAPASARGERTRPNGFQLFAKDYHPKAEDSESDQWNSLYGPWHNVVGGDWVKISLKVDPNDPKIAYQDPGFDPSRIMAIGVKMAVGTDSMATFNGSVFVDAIDWEPPASDTTAVSEESEASRSGDDGR
ncbi:MAG: toll/interleukin-1 receptor domain-containing protein [Planctomycetota bacterium]